MSAPCRASAGALASPGPEPRAAGAAAAEALAAVGPNVLLITLDTVRADHLGSYGYAGAATPRLDRLAAEGLRFDRAASTQPLTLPAHVSIMTGQYPFRHGVRSNTNFTLADDAITFAEILSAAGYATGGFIGAAVLDASTGVAQGFDAYTDLSQLANEASRPPGRLSEVERPAEEVIDEALGWIDGQSGSFFAWVHLFDAHAPYDPPAPFDARFASQPYDGEIAYVDREVGRLFDVVDARFGPQGTVVVVAADHGEGLGDHGEKLHSLLVYDSTIRVPLILRGPGVAPRTAAVARQASLVDVLPTLLGLLDLDDEAGGSRDGIDLLAAEGASESELADEGRVAYSESMYPLLQYGWSELRALSTTRYKYIAAPREELYDLSIDPSERNNLALEQPQRAASMRGEIDRLAAGDDPAQIGRDRGNNRAFDAADLERLRALGYIGGAAGSGSRRARGNDRGATDGVNPEGSSRVNPMDRIEAMESYQERILEAGATLAVGLSDPAQAALDSADRLIPGHYVALYYRGRLELARGNAARAIDVLEAAIDAGPDFTLSYVELAKSYKAAGQVAEAVALLYEAGESFPQTVTFPLLLATYLQETGEIDEALDVYLAAEALAPDEPRLLGNLALLRLQRGEAREAEALMGRLAQRTPDDPEVWNRLGMVRGSLGEFARAEQAFRRSLSLFSEQAPAHHSLGVVLLRQRRTEDAIAAFERALEVDPSYLPSRQELAKLRQQK